MSSAEQPIPVSVIVMTKNEEANMKDCLDSVAAFAEIFVVDSNSTDRTVEIATSMGAVVVPFTWNGQYPKKKQWALENLPFSHDHVLYLDADERVMPELSRSIASAVAAPGTIRGWFAGLDYVWEGRTLRHGDRVNKLALFERAYGRFVEWNDLDAERMWEVEGHYQPLIDGETQMLSGSILHDDHDALFDWFDRHNRYSDWEAVIRINGSGAEGAESQPGLRGRLKKLFLKLPAKPLIWFVYNYVVRSGWRDGRAGLNFAIAKAMYQWQIDMKIRERHRLTKTRG